MEEILSGAGVALNVPNPHGTRRSMTTHCSIGYYATALIAVGESYMDSQWDVEDPRAELTSRIALTPR